MEIAPETTMETAEKPTFIVPGTCVARQHHDPADSPRPARLRLRPRDPRARQVYLTKALGDLPRLIGAIDRNPLSPTYGCFDRQYWHYRTAAFPSAMYQEAVLPLALAYRHPLPENRWHKQPRLLELAVAGMRFAVRSIHPDGSCDDYYPYERALGAAVFSLVAIARAYELLGLADEEIRAGILRRARWVAEHDESGRLTNHHALAALGLLHASRLTGEGSLARAAEARLDRVLQWQDTEGWFHEYDGADPGYQTVTIDCLAKCRGMIGAAEMNRHQLSDEQSLRARVDDSLARAVDFARHFLHPDDTYGGEYGSRGTSHFQPHGCELLARHNAAAADLADAYLRALAAGQAAEMADDRLLAHRTGNFLEAYLDWSPERPDGDALASTGDGEESIHHFPAAGLLVRRAGNVQTIVSTARGGVFKHFPGSSSRHPAAPVCDAGLILETDGGRVATSQQHNRSREICHGVDAGLPPASPSANTPEKHGATPGVTVGGQLAWVGFQRATPLRQSVFHLGMISVGRHCRTFVRRLLQRWLITGRRRCPIHHTRHIQWLAERPGSQPGGSDCPRLRVTDTIELRDRRLHVKRMALGADMQTAYVAACGVYQPSTLLPWTDLVDHVEQLNRERRVTVVREW